MGTVTDTPTGREEQALIDRALETFEEHQRGVNARLDKEEMVDLAQRILALERGVPKNAFRLKPKDGHHHMQTARVLADGVDKGFGFEFDFVNATVTRGTLLDNRKFTITTMGGLGFCYDYLVMVNWTGDEGFTVDIPNSTDTFKVYSTIGGAITDANSDNESGRMYTIGVCPGIYLESISWPNSNAGHVHSGLAIIGLGQTDDHAGDSGVFWGSNTSASPIKIDAINPRGMQLENIVFDASAGVNEAIEHTAGIGLTGHAINCEFLEDVELSVNEFFFQHCSFRAMSVRGVDTDDLMFLDCVFDSCNPALDFASLEVGVAGLSVIGCDFINCTLVLDLQEGGGLMFVGNQLTGSTDRANILLIKSVGASSAIGNTVIANNYFEYATTTGNAIILLETAVASNAQILGVQITGNAFGKTQATVNSSTAIVKMTGNSTSPIRGCIVAHNTFPRDNDGGDTMEDNGGFSVIADFVVDSIFGPNTLIGKVKYAITNGTNNIIIPGSADDDPTDSGTLPISTFIADADGDTSVQVEKTSDEDIIHFNVGGTDDVMTISDHGVDIHTTAGGNDEHALELEVDAAGFGDVKAIDIAYETGALATGEAAAVVLINIDELDATGGDIFGTLVLATEGGANEVFGLGVGPIVGPIHQDSGTFVNPTTGTNNTASTDVADMIDGSEGTNTTIFVADNDFIIIGAAAAFTALEFNIETPASQPGIKPTFGYSTTGSGQFTTFSPIDGTNGFRNTGVVSWEPDELTGHVANDDTGTFDIKITRTHAVAGSVSLFFAKSATTVVFRWDKDGRLFIQGQVIGHTAQLTIGNTTPEFQSLGTANADGASGLGRFSADAFSHFLYFVKSRSASIGGTTIVQDNDSLGVLAWIGADGGDLVNIAASFEAKVDDASPAANDVGTEFVWAQQPGGGGARRTTMQLAADGELHLPLAESTGLGLLLGTTSPVEIFRSAASTLRLDTGVSNAFMSINGTTQAFGSAIATVNFLNTTAVSFTNAVGSVIVKFSDASTVAGTPSIEFGDGFLNVGSAGPPAKISLLDIYGAVAIGVTGTKNTDDNILHLIDTTTATSGSAQSGMHINLTAAPASNSALLYRAIRSTVDYAGSVNLTNGVIGLLGYIGGVNLASTAGTVTGAAGVRARMELSSAFRGIVTTNVCFWATHAAQASAAGTVANLYGFFYELAGPGWAGNTITTHVGIKLPDIDKGSTNWAIQADGAQSRHVGPFNFGSTSAPSANADVTLDGSGALCMLETTTPTADTNFGKIYTKTDNKMYFQDGAGTEHEVAFV